MKELLIAPFLVMILAGFAIEMADYANHTQETITNFAGSMNNGLDCATKGLPLEQCSPELFNTSFEEDLQNFSNINEEFLRDIQREFNAQNVEIEGNKIILRIE